MMPEMMKSFKQFTRSALLLVVLLQSGCVSRLHVVDFSSGETLRARYASAIRTVTVWMPDGEVLQGKYSAVGNESLSFGSGFTTGVAGGQTVSAFSQGTSVSTGGAGKAYAILKSKNPDSKLMMEILVSYGGLSGHGFGEARTNDGRTYRVTF